MTKPANNYDRKRYNPLSQTENVSDTLTCLSYMFTSTGMSHVHRVQDLLEKKIFLFTSSRLKDADQLMLRGFDPEHYVHAVRNCCRRKFCLKVVLFRL